MRHWTTLAGLTIADCLAFASAYYLCRHNHSLPAIVLFSGKSAPALGSGTDIFIILAGIFVVLRFVFGDYSRRQLFPDGARTTTNALILLSLPDLCLLLLVYRNEMIIPALLSWLFLLPAVPIYRQVARAAMTKMGLWQIPTAIVGVESMARTAYSALGHSLSLGFDVRYLILRGEDQTVPPELGHLQQIKLSDPAAMVTRLRELGCAEVIVANDNLGSPHMSEFIQRLIGTNIGVAVVPHLRGLPLSGMSTEYMFGKDLLLLQVRNNLARIPSRITKGIVDAIVPLILLVLFSPILIALAIAIKIDDGGPILFVQRRVGRGGREFSCVKFRTMRIDAENLLAKWQDERPEIYTRYIEQNFKLRDDPRVTRVGKCLRRLSLDELPQLLNVARGSMSLVGPRPLLAREVPDYGPGFDLYRRTKPGLTGLWQISGRSETTFSDRVAFDEWYILNWSLWIDVVILLKTAWIVFSSRGAY